MFTSNGRLITYRELLLDKKVILLIFKIYLKGSIVEIKTAENEHNFKLIKQKKVFLLIDLKLEYTVYKRLILLQKF